MRCCKQSTIYSPALNHVRESFKISHHLLLFLPSYRPIWGAPWYFLVFMSSVHRENTTQLFCTNSQLTRREQESNCVGCGVPSILFLPELFCPRVIHQLLVKWLVLALLQGINMGVKQIAKAATVWRIDDTMSGDSCTGARGKKATAGHRNPSRVAEGLNTAGLEWGRFCNFCDLITFESFFQHVKKVSVCKEQQKLRELCNYC